MTLRSHRLIFIVLLALSWADAVYFLVRYLKLRHGDQAHLADLWGILLLVVVQVLYSTARSLGATPLWEECTRRTTLLVRSWVAVSTVLVVVNFVYFSTTLEVRAPGPRADFAFGKTIYAIVLFFASWLGCMIAVGTANMLGHWLTDPIRFPRGFPFAPRRRQRRCKGVNGKT